MLKKEMEALSTLEQQDAIASKWLCCVLVVTMMVLAMYLIWCWYRARVAEEAASVQRSKLAKESTRITIAALQAEDYARFEKQIASLRAQNTALMQENTKLRTRLETILKAKGVHDEH